MNLSLRDRWILVKRAAVPVSRDAIGIGGLVLIDAGIADWSAAAAKIFAGAALVALAVMWARRS